MRRPLVRRICVSVSDEICSDKTLLSLTKKMILTEVTRDIRELRDRGYVLMDKKPLTFHPAGIRPYAMLEQIYRMIYVGKRRARSTRLIHQIRKEWVKGAAWTLHQST